MAGPDRPLLWSPEAEADLADIWGYYAGVAGQGTADIIIRGIGEACRILEEHPHAGRSRDEIRPGLRSIPRDPFVIFYRTAGDATQIVRILDGRRDIEEIFDHGQ